MLLSGALLWMFGRTANHIGASSLIFGLIAYLLVSGISERRIVPMIIAIAVGFLYGGTLASGVLPTLGVAYQLGGAFVRCNRRRGHCRFDDQRSDIEKVPTLPSL